MKNKIRNKRENEIKEINNVNILDKLEICINKIKERVNKKVLAVAIFCIFSFMIIGCAEIIKNSKVQKQQIEDEYNKSMYEAVSYINNLETDLAKLQIITTPRLIVATLSNIWNKSNLAKENFEMLPTKQSKLQNTSKYLTQVSDFSYMLLNNVARGRKITEKEYVQIEEIYEKCKKLNLVMNDIYISLNTGKIRWDELKKETNSKLSNINLTETISNFDKIDKTFQDYEGLIYDGAFSDHLLENSPKSLSENIVTIEQAIEYIKNIFENENIDYIKSLGESSGKIQLYNFEVKLKKEDMIRNLSITKNDCKLYLMISDRIVQSENINIEEAKMKAETFLDKIGINNAVATYFQKTDNMATINYAAVQENVTLYSDLVKVKIALDTGEVCSIESQGYIFNHIQRENLMPKLSLSYVKEKLNKKFNIISEKLAVIPTEYNTEILVYEFNCKLDEKEFLVYINANTGLEEKVLLVIETPNGTFTM